MKYTSSGEPLPRLCGIEIRSKQAGTGGGGVVVWGSSPVYEGGSGEGFGAGAGRLEGDGNVIYGEIIHGNPGVAVVMVC